MAQCAGRWSDKRIGVRCAFVILVMMTLIPAPLSAQTDRRPPQVGEGSLLYRSPVSGAYESVPLTHTDVALDVRGMVVSATVTQQ